MLDFSRAVQLGWYKLNNAAIVPSKTENNAGFDIYTIEKNVVLNPHEHHLFSTGLAVVVEPGWWLMAMDRGSTGSKGIHIHCGVIDNNYRGEVFICLKTVEVIDYFVYPVAKAIAQIIVVPQPKVNSKELSDAEWEIYKNTDRGDGKLGSSGK